jgi:predicted phosphodiesterase
MPGYAREIARRVPVRIVAFGHTHRPRLVPLERGVSFLDSGTWAPIARATGEPAPGYWNYALVDFEGEKLAMDFGSWRDTQPRPAETPVTESAPAHAERAA